jgi:hypothetical protein
MSLIYKEQHVVSDFAVFKGHQIGLRKFMLRVSVIMIAVHKKGLNCILAY